jgi:hypothetical protein
MKRGAILFGGILALAAAGGYVALTHFGARPASELAASASASAPREAKPAAPPSAPLTVVATATPSAVAKEAALKVIPFGTGEDALGGGKAANGASIAPGSFVVAGDDLLVLDQEKSRLLTIGGKAIPLPGRTAQDIARGEDGSLAVLDAKENKEVSVLGPDGRVRGRFPLQGTGIDDPKDVSRVFVDGNDVYVERNGGGPLLRLGSTDGSAAKERTEIAGIPTRDGKGLVSAGITNEDDGRAWVNLADRKGVHLWTRELRFPAELSAVGFVDSEKNGTLWVVLLAGSTPADYTNWAVCLDVAGNVRGSFTLAVENPPWESFRDFAVRESGGLVAAVRSDQGVSYATYNCP